ncbi:hypothetical protein [Rhizobium leguminosarum]|uniref:hypothetical protein n=1 Tax=Rhizobium leguminosarum TaxID=384 RepID=UPI001A93414F|nr:hypothetical protein [Rhizobium leguminosarum]MBY5554129.1 hypothetical protein [Rhizobium leguminosarum]MBY5723555.1 hypothetical protein [Rhizobium leguminosarum]QSW27248.1 hypothetical protein J0664_30950 [Rhizobium leguminosarum]
MSLLTADCPRCGTKHVSFDVQAQQSRGVVTAGWVERFETFAICRHCHKPTIMILDNKTHDAAANWRHQRNAVVEYQGYLNDHFAVKGYISLKVERADEPPEHVPDDIAAIFSEVPWNAGMLLVPCFGWR